MCARDSILEEWWVRKRASAISSFGWAFADHLILLWLLLWWWGRREGWYHFRLRLAGVWMCFKHSLLRYFIEAFLVHKFNKNPWTSKAIPLFVHIMHQQVLKHNNSKIISIAHLLIVFVYFELKVNRATF